MFRSPSRPFQVPSGQLVYYSTSLSLCQVLFRNFFEIYFRKLVSLKPPLFPFRPISFQPIPLRSASCLRLGSRTRTCAWSAHFASLRSAFSCRCLLMYYNSFFVALFALRSRGDLIILPYFFPFVNPHFYPFSRFYALHKTSRVTRIKSRQFALGHPPYTGMNRLYTSPQLPI